MNKIDTSIPDIIATFTAIIISIAVLVATLVGTVDIS